MARLSWRKEPNERGLASIGQPPRGYELRFDGKQIAGVSPLFAGWSRDIKGWYYCARSDEYGVPLMNTCSGKPFATKDEAKAACDAYVRKHFKKPED
jgi:hypothetical protein